jgi:hypothetical protein
MSLTILGFIDKHFRVILIKFLRPMRIASMFKVLPSFGSSFADYNFTASSVLMGSAGYFLKSMRIENMPI